MRFDSNEHVTAYYESGVFPKIHDDIFRMCKHINGHGAVLDIGCCRGLLSVRLAGVYEKVIGIDANAGYIESAIRCDNVEYHCIKICDCTLDKIGEIASSERVFCAFARRVLPEIWDTGGYNLVEAFAETLRRAGVKCLVVEGRMPVKSAKNQLSSVDREIAAVSGSFHPVLIDGRCSILEANGNEEL